MWQIVFQSLVGPHLFPGKRMTWANFPWMGWIPFDFIMYFVCNFYQQMIAYVCSHSLPSPQMWWLHTTILGASCPRHWVSVSPCFRSCFFCCSRSLWCPLTSTCSLSPDCYVTDSCVRRRRVFLHLRRAQPSSWPAGHYCKLTKR